MWAQALVSCKPVVFSGCSDISPTTNADMDCWCVCPNSRGPSIPTSCHVVALFVVAMAIVLCVVAVAMVLCVVVVLQIFPDDPINISYLFAVELPHVASRDHHRVRYKDARCKLQDRATAPTKCAASSASSDGYR